MAGTTIKVTVEDRPVLEALNRLLAASVDMRPVLKVIGEHMVQSTERRFDRETAPDGAPWQQVTAQTRKHKKHPKILTESHRLRGSIIYQLGGASTVEIGTNVVYAAIHQFGGKIERAAHSSWRGLRVDARGNLLRQGTAGRAANLAVFAKASHKRTKQVRFTVGAYGIDMPARPFLGVSREDRQTILDDLNDYLERSLGGRS